MGVLCNSGLRQRHWKSMSEIIGDNITPDSGTTLRKMLKNDITPCFEQFEIISTGASKVRVFKIDFINLINFCNIYYRAVVQYYNQRTEVDS